MDNTNCLSEEALYRSIMGMWGENSEHARVYRLLWSSHGALQNTVLSLSETLKYLSKVCAEAQDFIKHDKNCDAVMGRSTDCDCGYDSMWSQLNNCALWGALTKEDK